MGIYDDLMEIKDLDEFEIARQKLIDDFIESLPEDRQLKARQLQFRIDRELRGYTNPIARMNKMVELFWEGFNEFNATIHNASEKLGS